MLLLFGKTNRAEDCPHAPSAPESLHLANTIQVNKERLFTLFRHLIT